MKNKKLLIFLCLIIIVFVFLVIFRDKLLKIIYPKKYSEIVSIYEEQYGVEENLIFAVIKAESNFNKNAVSHKGAIGLMQLMEETAKDVAVKNNIQLDFDNIKQELLKVDNNINVGTMYLKILLDRYKSIELAVAAYNAGIGNVDEWIKSRYH